MGAREPVRAGVQRDTGRNVGVAARERPVATDLRRAGSAHRLGLLRECRQDWVGAVEAFEAAVGFEPGWAARHYRLGVARERMWDLAGAEEAFTAAVDLAPGRGSWSRRRERVRAAAMSFRPFGGVIVAHRGGGAGSAENALAGLTDPPPVTAGVEVDARCSRDGVVVLMHDTQIGRTTGGEGRVEELTYAELREHGVPSLADYLAACASTDFELILLDVKVPDRETLRAVAGVVRASVVTRSCVVMVRGERALYEFREVADDLRLGGLGVRLVEVDRRVAVAAACDAELLLVAHGDERYLANRGAVTVIQATGLSAGASVVNSRVALEAVRVDGCDVLLTDRADQLAYFHGKPAGATTRSRSVPPSV